MATDAPLSLLRIDARRDDVAERLAPLRRKLSPEGDVVSEAGRRRTIEVFGEPLTPQAVVARICQDVRRRGFDAVAQYTGKLDGVALTRQNLLAAPERIAAAREAADPELLAAVRRVRDNILQFQQAILHRDVVVRPRPGVTLRHCYRPLRRVGVCVPGGAAAYPSTVLMTVVPALAAGVDQIVVAAPPTPFGADHPDVLAVCGELGVTQVLRAGGAQGVAAMAYGVDGLERVDKIVGPGNLFVALAKQFVFGAVDIDAIAGPSEVVVLADQTADPRHVAAELLAQAEHSPGAAVLISWADATLDEVQRRLGDMAARLDRARLALESLAEYGALIRAADADQACQLAEQLAPEHLQITAAGAEELAERIRCAGAVFLGPYTPVAIGDYVAGPSHVLPTSGTARWASGLTANDFLRSFTRIAYTREALAAAAPDLRQLAQREGLTAHRASVDVRLEPGS